MAYDFDRGQDRARFAVELAEIRLAAARRELVAARLRARRR